MPTIAVTTARSPVRTLTGPGVGVPRMTIREELSGFTVSVPYAPREMELSGQANTYEQVPRPGRAPLLVHSGQQLEERSFDLVLVDRNQPGVGSVQDIVGHLRRLARTPERLVVKFGSSSWLWRIRELTIRVTRRSEVGDLMTAATASVVLVRASDAVLAVGPVTGGAKPPAAPAPPPPAAPRTHVVTRGETLSGIALRYYRDADAWRRIADHNQIRNPNLIVAGQRLVIP